MRIVKIATGLLMVTGLIMIIGTIGKSDLMTAAHQVYSAGDLFRDLLAGIMLMVPYLLIRRKG